MPDIFEQLAANQSVAAPAAPGDIFDRLAAQSQSPASPPAGGEITNDIGKTVIVPKDGEAFSETLSRAVAQGRKTKQKDIDDELATAPGKAATVLAAAPAIGAVGAASLTGAGVLGKEALSLGSEYAEYGAQKVAEMAAEHPEATKFVVKTLAGLLAGEGLGLGHAKSAGIGLLLNLLK